MTIYQIYNISKFQLSIFKIDRNIGQKPGFFEFLASNDKALHSVHVFPNIRHVYLKYNTILPAQAGTERLFSIGGLTFNTKQHSLHDENFEQQCMLNCNSHFYRSQI